MPFKDPIMRRASSRERSARYRARHPEKSAAVERRRRADLRAAVLNEKLRRGKCFNPDCPLGGLVITPDNAMGFDFDHRDRSKKRDMVPRVRDRTAILEEMAKCDLLCAFCHRLKTAREDENRPVLIGDIFSEEYQLALFDEDPDGTATLLRQK